MFLKIIKTFYSIHIKIYYEYVRPVSQCKTTTTTITLSVASVVKLQ